ncbi:MAG TPA: LptF/LptG family permease [Bacteroidales bacterium]|jgi:lipopolysaccharide export system permease protein|nr:LptF/LptG family permease [Bacteroidales bacterium]
MENRDGKKTFRETLALLKIKLIDWYIIRKFLGTFFFSLILILTIAVVFDFAEKIDNFMERQAPVKAIVFDYYMNFIPYFATLFSPLFVFIAVIFFTSKMAINTEIIAILNSGMSFRRMMWPYFLSAVVIASFSFTLTNFVIPQSNLKRMNFEDVYYRPSNRRIPVENIHRMESRNVFIFMGTYNPLAMRGQNFTIDKFDDNGKLVSKLSAYSVVYDTTIKKWTALNYFIREIKGNEEVITKGDRIDTALTIRPVDLSRDPGFVGTMTYRELNDYIGLLKIQGSDELKLFLIEKHRRFANPFAVFILTLIGVSLSSRKIRGGLGMNIGIGLALSFSYILFLQFSSQFSLKGDLGPMLAMWIPNIIFASIALVLYKLAPK